MKKVRFDTCKLKFFTLPLKNFLTASSSLSSEKFLLSILDILQIMRKCQVTKNCLHYFLVHCRSIIKRRRFTSMTRDNRE